MAKLDQQFKEMIEEIRIIRSQSGSYIENSTKPGDYPQLEIKSAGFTLNKEEVSKLSDDKPVITTIIADNEEETKEKGEVDLIDHGQSDSNQNGEELDLNDYCKSDSNQNHNGEEAVHTPDLSHDTVFDFTSEEKPVPDSSIVTMMIREEREKVLPVEKKRELVVGEGSSDYVFDLGGYESTKPRCADSPESGGLGWRLDPGSDPPDGSFSIPLVDSTPLALTIESSKSITGVGHNHPDRRLLPVVPPPSSGAKVTEVGLSDEIGFQTVYIGSGFWLKKETEKSTRPILMNLVGPKPSKFISTCPNLNPNVIGTINRLTDTITTYSGYWVGDDRQKLPPPLPPSLPPPLLPLTTRSTSNAYGTTGNRWWETDNRTSRFDTCKEIGKKSQSSEEEILGVDGFLKEKNQEVELLHEKNQKMEFFNPIVGVKSGYCAGPISILWTGSSTLLQNSNPYATQLIQFAADFSQFREPYETTSRTEEIGGSLNLKINQALQRIMEQLSWDGEAFYREEISSESGLIAGQQNYGRIGEKQGGSNNFASERCPLKPDAEVSMTLKAWQLGLDPDMAYKSISLNAMRQAKDGNNTMKIELVVQDYKEGDDQYIRHGLNCLFKCIIAQDIWVDNATLIYHFGEAFNVRSLNNRCNLFALENSDKLNSQLWNVSPVKRHPVDQWVSIDFSGGWPGRSAIGRHEFLYFFYPP